MLPDLRWRAALGYLAITALFLAPVAGRLGDELVGHAGGDNLGSLWNAWWISRSLLHLENPWWTDLLFAPEGTPLVWHSLAILPSTAIAVLSAWLPALVAYNLVLLAALPIAGLGAFTLCRHLTGDGAASFAGGCAFMLCPFLVSKTLGHVDLAYAGLLAFFLAALLQALEGEGRARWRLGATSFLLLGVSPNAPVFAANLVLVLFCLEVRRSSVAAALRRFARALAPSAFVVLPYALLLAGYSLAYGVAPRSHQDLAYNPEPVSYLLPFSETSVYSDLARPIGSPGLAGVEPAAYLGLLVLPLAVAGFVLRRRDPVARALAVSALVFLALSLGPKLLWRREVVEVGGASVYLPFALWRHAPVLGWVGQAGRYLVVVYLVLSAGVAYAVGRARARWGAGAVVVAVAIVCADYAFQPVLAPPPPALRLSEAAPDRRRVLDPRLGSSDTMYQQTHHGRPIVGGYLSRPPRRALDAYRADPVLAWFFEPGSAALPERAALLERLRALAVGDVLLGRGDPRGAQLAAYGFETASEDDYTTVWSRPD